VKSNTELPPSLLTKGVAFTFKILSSFNKFVTQVSLVLHAAVKINSFEDKPNCEFLSLA
jgi:hypothetical protein